MKKIIASHLALALVTILFSSMAFANHTIVKCWPSGKTSQYIQLKVTMKGFITRWSEEKFAESDGNSFLSYFSESEEFFEGIRYSKAKNGYALITGFSTADAVTVGVSPDFTKGFYKYEDHGSGNGDSTVTLKCKAMIAFN